MHSRRGKRLLEYEMRFVKSFIGVAEEPTSMGMHVGNIWQGETKVFVTSKIFMQDRRTFGHRLERVIHGFKLFVCDANVAERFLRDFGGLGADGSDSFAEKPRHALRQHRH